MENRLSGLLAQSQPRSRMRSLLDVAQAASNAVASGVSGPVDLTAAALRSLGVPVPENAIGSSQWFEQMGLTRPVEQGAARVVGETLGMAGPAVVAMGAPKVAAGLIKAGDNLAAPKSPAMYASQRGRVDAGLSMDEASRAARMQEMGMERGWYRGGPEPVGGKRTGPWYTQDATEAAGYAKGRDVREYAIPASKFLAADGRYSSRLAHDVAKILDDPSFGKQGAGLAKELRTFGPSEGLTGGQLWQALEARFGNDGAADVIGRLGAFNGVKGITAPGEAYVFKTSPVRDANKAVFDPARANVDDIYGAATPGAMATAAGTSLGALGLWNMLGRDQPQQ